MDRTQDAADPAQQPTWLGPLDLRRWGLFLAARGRQGWRRVEGSFVPILIAAAGASLAWWLGTLLGRYTPLFAPIAVWVCLGFKIDRVPRKVAELGLGATVGVLIGELFAEVFKGAGWWQIGVVLVVSALVGRFLDRGDLTTIQSGVNAVVIVGMSWWQTQLGGVQGRWIEALIGAGVAFVFAALLPRHPTSRPRRYARSTLTEFAKLLDMLGRGLSQGDVELLADARAQRRALLQVMADWEETLTTAREVVTVNPSLWARRDEVRELDRIFRLTRRAVSSADTLARMGLSMTEEVGHLPGVGGLVSELATATYPLAGAIGNWNRPQRAREALLEVAGRAAPAEIATEDWRPSALMALVRALVVDLLQLSGMSREGARDALPDTWGRPFGVREANLPQEESDDDASGLWA